MPKRSTSYLGVSRATTSMSHPLQAPVLKWSSQGDFALAHLNILAVDVVRSLLAAVNQPPKSFRDILANEGG